MFTLSGRFLEDGEILFQDFWSPFSIYFLHFSVISFLKKSTDLPGHGRPGLCHRPGLYKPAPCPAAHPASPPPSQPTLPPNPSRRRRAAPRCASPPDPPRDTSILHHAFISIFIALWAFLTHYVTILMPILSYFTRFT